jgi:hypothetical protein
MGREMIRRASVALHHAAEARTVEYQVRHADEARRAYEHALRAVTARFEAAERKPTHESRVIARRAVFFELEALLELEQHLTCIEKRIVDAAMAQTDPHDYRRLRLVDYSSR